MTELKSTKENLLSSGLKLKREEGFTLLEVMLAISILMVGLLAVASMQVSAIRGNAYASRQTEGTGMALDRMEKLLDLPYDNADLATGNHADPNPPSGYSVSWGVTDDAPLSNTKTVSVTVTWIDHGAQKSVSMQRVVPRSI